jgi:beta-lactam-binding protein with PASTA domain
VDSVIGLDVSEAKLKLEEQGLEVRIVEYVSRRGIENADSTRVIREQMIGDNVIELAVSHFKTQMSDE